VEESRGRCRRLGGGLSWVLGTLVKVRGEQGREGEGRRSEGREGRKGGRAEGRKGGRAEGRKGGWAEGRKGGRGWEVEG
jgi:hypothetical protein